jgi:transposase
MEGIGMGEQRKYDKAFKEQVVLRILSKETTVSKMAAELGLHYTSVRDWVRSYRQDSTAAFPGSGNLKPEDDEIRRLQRELADIKEENEILKKAAAYFA